MANRIVSCASAAASFLALFTILQLWSNSAEAELTCRDEDGNPVDWYIGYKFPKISQSKDTRFSQGYAYSYLTSEDVKRMGDFDDQQDDPKVSDDTKIPSYQIRYASKRQTDLGELIKQQPKPTKRITRGKQAQIGPPNIRWSVSDHLLTDKESVIMKTLEIAYDEERGASINRVFYNDDPPSNDEGEKVTKANSRRAHAKGVLLMDENEGNGIWLTHSVPQFPPPVHQELKFHNNSVPFGQTFMCVNFNVKDSGKKIVDHLVNMRALVYEHYISPKMYELIPDLEDLEHEDDTKYKRFQAVPKLSQMFVSKGGQEMHLYSKSALYDEDMYSGWIDHELGSPLYVETWRRGTGTPLSSSCPKKDYHVNNVNNLKYDGDLKWTYVNDHSKWAITDEQKSGVVCIGDQNRMKSQFKRGGGALCIKCPTCWSAFSNTIEDVEPCPAPSKKKASLNKLLADKIPKLKL